MKNKKLGILIISSIILIIMAAGVSVYLTRFMPITSQTDFFDTSVTSLVIDGEIINIAPGVRMAGDEVLMPIEIVKAYFDPYIWWDAAQKKVTVTTADRVVRMQTDSLNALVNDKPVELNMPVTIDKDTVYIPVDFLKDLYGIDITYIKSTNCVIVDYRDSIVRIAEPLIDVLPIRSGRTVRATVVKMVGKTASTGATGSGASGMAANSMPGAQATWAAGATAGTTAGSTAASGAGTGGGAETVIRIYEEYEKWYKVRASDGTLGYVEKKDVVVKLMRVGVKPGYKPKGAAWKPEAGMINLVWDVGDKADLYKTDTKIKGLDIISPLWFDFETSSLTLKNQANSRSLDWARKNGYQVWPVLKNDNLKPSASSAFLNSTALREKLIRELLVYCALYKFDGINVDLENINLPDRNALTQFIRELSPLLREQGLAVSMCVGVPDGSDNFSKCYDTKALGEAVDYIMAMTYDQHWNTSPVAGSVAQLTWVEMNIKKLLQLVPRDKLLLGLPLYNRLWKEDTAADGTVKVTNAAVLRMVTAKQYIRDNNATVEWDSVSGQFYAEYIKGGALYKIWLEDENSINLKSSLALKYRLAGAASWRINMETALIWEILNTNLKVYDTFDDWQLVNQDGEPVILYN